MSKLSRLFFLTIVLSVITMCSKIDEFEYTFECGFEFETHNRNCISDNFLVDRIYDYHHNLLAQFIYDDENRLTKRIITTLSVHPIRTDEMRSEDKFEYRNGRVSRIINHTRSHTIFHQFDFEDRREFRSETTFEYDSQGRLIRRNGKDLNFRYENGRIVGLFKESNDPFIHRDTLVYDNSGNIIKHIRIVPELTMFGQPIPGTSRRVVHHFEYDNRPRPNFGLDDLFVFQPLPQMGNFLDYQMLLSRNNLTKATEDRHAFVYTYNEFGLPATIEKIWLDCGESGYECVRNVLRIVYRRIR